MSKLIHKNASLLLMLAAVVLTMSVTACGGQGKDKGAQEDTDTSKIAKEVRLPGDSTVYGLACEGCTDSVLVLLPHDDSDPVTYNIILAMRNRRVIGRPQIGDNIAVVVNGEDSTVADMVVDMDELKGTWVNAVMPTLRKHAPMPGAKMKPSPEMDSLLQTLMVPREQGFRILKQNQMEPVGMQMKTTSLTGESPVEYPEVKFYKEWYMLNGKLVLTEGTIDMGNKKKVKRRPVRDTVEIVFMMRDSLQLRYSDGSVKGYYRK